jgi:hypothetical protein
MAHLKTHFHSSDEFAKMLLAKARLERTETHKKQGDFFHSAGSLVQR